MPGTNDLGFQNVPDQSPRQPIPAASLNAVRDAATGRLIGGRGINVKVEGGNTVIELEASAQLTPVARWQPYSGV